MRSFEAASPFDLVAMDVLDLTERLSGSRHIIVAVDAFTRFLWADAIQELKAPVFARFLLTSVGRFGVPRCILTDGAPFFKNDLATAFASRFHIERRFSTPHHHEGNGIAERMIRTLQEKLSIICNDPATSLDWEDALPTAVLSINTSTCSSTGFSPFELIFGRKHPLWTDSMEISDPATRA